MVWRLSLSAVEASIVVLLVLTLGLPRAHCHDIVLESFKEPIHEWKQMNDPVMGGKSTGTFAIEKGVGVFDGEVVDVPFLKAPGFIKVAGSGGSFPDISSCAALKLVVKTTIPYQGYRVSFGNAHAPGGKFFAFGYKADFNPPPVDSFGDVIIPLDEFSDYWDDATGDAIVSCKENNLYCPDTKTLKNMRKIEIWAEGVSGKVHLEIQSIQATDCTNDPDNDEAMELRDNQ